MGEIYAGSVCTIAALTARNAHDGGCFFEHARNPLFFRPCRLNPRWSVEGNPYVGTDLRLGPPSLGPFPLHTRAWVVQERLLAPRTLYYGYNGLAWECATCSATEGVPEGEQSRFSPKASFFEIMRQLPGEDRSQGQVADPELLERIYDLWTDIQIAYSRCLLTHFDDRLVAISGVVKRIEAATGWRSMWGMWRERILADILWFTEEPSVRPKTSEYLAPTWSWAGLEGRVMTAIGGGGMGCEWTAEVLSDGKLTDGRGYLHLKAMVKPVILTAGGRLNPGITSPAQSWEEIDWNPDEMLEDTDVGCELQCVSVVRIPDYLGPGTFAFEIGLVTKKASQDESWLRIGVFRQLRNGTALFGESLENATELTLL